jgi:hypothetical protein
LKFIKLNNESSEYGCQPKIEIYKDYFYEENKPRAGIWVNGNYLKATSLLEKNED